LLTENEIKSLLQDVEATQRGEIPVIVGSDFWNRAMAEMTVGKPTFKFKSHAFTGNTDAFRGYSYLGRPNSGDHPRAKLEIAVEESPSTPTTRSLTVRDTDSNHTLGTASSPRSKGGVPQL
jgi:hypothetical protein